MTKTAEQTMPPIPVADPAAWLAEDLAGDTSWIDHLSAEDLAELDQAVETVLRAGFGECGFGREDFPLPTLRTRIARWVHDLDQGRGCVLVRGLDPTRYDQDALLALYWGLAVHLGTPIPQNAKGDLIGHVRDTGREYRAKNVRGYTTNDRMRAHCDSADVVGLLCRHPAMRGGESQIASGISIFNHLAKEHPEYLAPLMQGFHFDLRGEGVTDDPDETTFHRVPVFSWHAGRLSCRFNAKTIEDGMRKAGMPLSGIALEAVHAIGDLAAEVPFRYDMTFEQGDIQLLCNHSILHARAGFEDWPEPERRRDLWRLWLNLRDGRPLEPAFADRLNTGPRGGVMVRAAAQ